MGKLVDQSGMNRYVAPDSSKVILEEQQLEPESLEVRGSDALIAPYRDGRKVVLSIAHRGRGRGTTVQLDRDQALQLAEMILKLVRESRGR